MPYLCIDVGGTNLKYAIINRQFEILDYNCIAATFQNREEYLSTIEKIYNGYKLEIKGIAMSYCGEVNSQKGFVYNGGSYPFNSAYDMKGIIENRCHIPVTVEKDGHCALLTESQIGILKGVQNGVVLTLGTGIGCSFLINGSLYRGSHYYAGGASFAMTNLCEPMRKSNIFVNVGSSRFLTRQSHEDNCQQFFSRVHHQDMSALNALQEYSQYIAAYIYNIQVLMDVDLFAIGGGISSQPLLLEKICESIDSLYNHFPVELPRPKVKACQYFNDANLIGALCFHLSVFE